MEKGQCFCLELRLRGNAGGKCTQLPIFEWTPASDDEGNDVAKSWLLKDTDSI